MDAVCDAVEQAFNRAPMSSYYTFTKKNSPTLEGAMNRHLQTNRMIKNACNSFWKGGYAFFMKVICF